MTVMFGLVWTVAFDISRILKLASKSGVLLLLAILALRDTRIYVCSLNCCNEAFCIETSVNQAFSLTSTLNILYV